MKDLNKLNDPGHACTHHCNHLPAVMAPKSGNDLAPPKGLALDNLTSASRDGLNK